jgi:hypothetical protein
MPDVRGRNTFQAVGKTFRQDDFESRISMHLIVALGLLMYGMENACPISKNVGGMVSCEESVDQ